MLHNLTGKAVDVVDTCRKPIASESYSTVPVYYDRDEKRPRNMRVEETTVQRAVPGDRDVDMYVHMYLYVVEIRIAALIHIYSSMTLFPVRCLIRRL